MTDADDLNTSAQAESLLHSLHQAVGDICLAISTLSGKPLKFVNQFKYLSSNISSTEGDRMGLIGYWSCGSLIYPIK